MTERGHPVQVRLQTSCHRTVHDVCATPIRITIAQAKRMAESHGGTAPVTDQKWPPNSSIHGRRNGYKITARGRIPVGSGTGREERWGCEMADSTKQRES
jgi:hypothetical protein